MKLINMKRSVLIKWMSLSCLYISPAYTERYMLWIRVPHLQRCFKKKTWKNNQYNIKETRQCMNKSNEIAQNFPSIDVFVTKSP